MDKALKHYYVCINNICVTIGIKHFHILHHILKLLLVSLGGKDIFLITLSAFSVELDFRNSIYLLHRKVLVNLLFLVVSTAHLIRVTERSRYVCVHLSVSWLFNAGTKRIWQVLQTLLLLRRPPD